MLLYINWDGFSASWYRMAHASPLGTPNLDNLIAQGTVLLQQRCGIPAITNPMQQALISGAWPEKTGNCYCYFDKAARRIVKTGRLNPCETIAEAAVRHGLTCASIHGWYVENRGCTPGDAGNPYIADISLRNFEGRVQLLLDYLAGKPVPSGEKMITLLNRPDFLTIYADDIDTVCHNGARLPYAEMRRASTIDEWYENIQYAVWRMDQALERAVANGVKNLVVQPTHLMHGAEYDELVEAIEKYQDKFETVRIAEPLLGEVGSDATVINEDKAAVAEAITSEAVKAAGYDSMDAAAEAGTAFVFMGHGTSADSNGVYQKMQDLLTSGGHTNYFVGTVEASPSLDDIIAAVKAGGYKKVVLEPLMVVAGDHANNDMAGDEDDSWKSAFEKEGYEVTCLLRGLGENETIRQLYVAHAQAAVNAIEGVSE